MKSVLKTIVAFAITDPDLPMYTILLVQQNRRTTHYLSFELASLTR